MHLRFENPGAFWIYLPLALFLAFMLFQGKRFPGTLSIRRCVLAGLAFGLCILGFSRPQLGQYQTSQSALRSNLFLMLDISKSMLTEDVPPSRLGFMAAFCRRLLQTMPGIRVAIFPFARDGYLQMPLSNDVDAAADMIGALSPTMVTSQGSDISAALQTLYETIAKMQEKSQESGTDWAPTQILLLSDGEAHGKLDESVVKKFRDRRMPIFTVGVGTTEGGFVPVEGRFGTGRENLRDREGRTVRSRLEAETLKRISNLSGGDYFPSRFEAVYQLKDRLTQSMELGRLASTFTLKFEYYPLLFALALIFFTIELGFGRWEYALRGWIVFAFLSTMAVSRPALALSEENEEKLSKLEGQARVLATFNEGVAELARGNAQEAAELFGESAANTKSAEVRKQALYNLGNAWLRLGDPAQALQAYQQAFDVKSGNRKLDDEANKRITDNIQLATKIEEQMKKQQKMQQSEKGEGEEKESSDDPKGPQQNFQAQFFDDKQKQRIFDLISGEEQQIMQRIQSKKNRGKPTEMNGKEW